MISHDMEILINAARSGGVSRSSNGELSVIVPASLEKWAKDAISKATPTELEELENALKSNFIFPHLESQHDQ